jgi:ribosome-binding protein aMBF1 (putative translation factor)
MVPPIGAQIEALRREARWSIARLADTIKRDRRTVARHIGGKMTPSLKTIREYEAAFSARLNRARAAHVVKRPEKFQNASSNGPGKIGMVRGGRPPARTAAREHSRKVLDRVR